MVWYSLYLESSFLLPFMVKSFSPYSDPTHASPLCNLTSVLTTLLKLFQTRPQWPNRLWSYFSSYQTWRPLQKAVPPSASTSVIAGSAGFLFPSSCSWVSLTGFFSSFSLVNVDSPSTPCTSLSKHFYHCLWLKWPFIYANVIHSWSLKPILPSWHSCFYGL